MCLNAEAALQGRFIFYRRATIELTNGFLLRYNNMIYYVHGGVIYVDRGQVAGL